MYESEIRCGTIGCRPVARDDCSIHDLVEGDWHVDLNLKKSPPNLGPQFAEIAELPIDYTMPNVCRYGQEEFHCFNDYTRKSFSTALRAIAQVSK